MTRASTLTRRFARPSTRGRGRMFRSFPLPLGEGGAKRRVRVEGRIYGILSDPWATEFTTMYAS